MNTKFIKNIQRKCEKFSICIPDEKLIELYKKCKHIPVSKFNKNNLLNNKKILDYEGQITIKFIQDIGMTRNQILFSRIDDIVKLNTTDTIGHVSIIHKKKNKLSLFKYFSSMVKYQTNKYTPSKIKYYFQQIYDLIPLKYFYKIRYIRKMSYLFSGACKNINIEIIIQGMRYLNGKYFDFDPCTFLKYCYAIVFVSSCQFNIDSIIKFGGNTIITKDHPKCHELKKVYIDKIHSEFNNILENAISCINKRLSCPPKNRIYGIQCLFKKNIATIFNVYHTIERRSLNPHVTRYFGQINRIQYAWYYRCLPLRIVLNSQKYLIVGKKEFRLDLVRHFLY